MSDTETAQPLAEERLSTKDKIGVLMGEYSSLLAEIHHRITLLLTLAGTGITVAIAVTGAIVAHPQWVALYVLLLVAIALYVGFAIPMDLNIHHLTKRVRELEAQVNLLAGERLLKWETHHGVGSLLDLLPDFAPLRMRVLARVRGPGFLVHYEGGSAAVAIAP